MSSGKPPFSGNGPGGSRDEKPRSSEPQGASGGRTVKCPRCGKPARWEGNPDRPFCGERCRLIDLGQWADGSYAIPDEKVVPDKDDEE